MRKFYALLGLSKKAGKLLSGEGVVEATIRKKEAVQMLILAADASENTKKKFRNAAKHYEIPLLECGTKEDLGYAVGGEIRAIFAVIDAGFAKRLMELYEQSDSAQTEA